MRVSTALMFSTSLAVSALAPALALDSPDTIVVPLLVWLATNQPDLIADTERRYKTLTFEAEPVDHDALDIVFNLELSERVIVRAVPGGFECEHVDEPLLPDLDGPTAWTLYLAEDPLTVLSP